MVGGKRRSIIATLVFLILLGIAVYFRLWAIHYDISSDESELLRRQFDLANREAIDEAAEWRLRYDNQRDRATKCLEQLQMIKESSQKGLDASGVNYKVAVLQKENAVLLERVATLKRVLEEEKLKCNAQYMN